MFSSNFPLDKEYNTAVKLNLIGPFNRKLQTFCGTSQNIAECMK